MRFLFLFFVFLLSLEAYAQYPTYEDWQLLYIIEDDEITYAPLEEDISVNFVSAPDITGFLMTVQGVTNVLVGDAVFFDIDPLFGLINVTITTEDCSVPACDFEELLFYSFFTSPESNSQLFEFYEENLGGGHKTLMITNHEGTQAFFQNSPITVNPALLGTWYIFQQDTDLGDSSFYDPSVDYGITINTDLSFNGTDDCVLYEGNFTYEEETATEFFLQMESYVRNTENCNNGNDTGTRFPDFIEDQLFYTTLYEQNGEEILTLEGTAGFTMYFTRNTLSLSDFVEFDVHLYPNPANDFIQLETNADQNFKVQIMDMLGKRYNALSLTNSSSIDISNLPSGIYFITITTDNSPLVRKFIKK